MKKNIWAVMLFFFISLPTSAQMISQTLDSGGGFSGAGIGQSFVATATTQITQISVRSLFNYTGPLYIYNGNVGSGTVGALGAPAYTEAVVNFTSSGGGGPMSAATLTTPFPITAGNSYTFVLGGGASLFARSGNVYADGQLITNFANLTNVNSDLAFQIFTAPVATPTAIPTLSEWGLIFMSGLLAIFGLVSVRRRKASA